MQEPEPPSIRAPVRYALIAAKIALSVGLLCYAFSNIDLHEAWSQMRHIAMLAAVATLLVLFLEAVVASMRLQQILGTMGVQCPLIQTLDVVFVGAFFSQTLVSFVGGDAMRIWRIMRSKVAFGLAAKSVVLDRAAGLAGLIVLVGATLPFLLGLVTDPVMRFSLIVTLIGGVGAFATLPSLRYLPDALTRLRPFRWIAELAALAVSVTRSARSILILMGLSISIHVLNVITVWVLAMGLVVQLSFWQCLLLIPPVMFLSTLPISVAGWGVREGAMIVALGLVGVTPAQSVALSVCFGLGVLAISVPGGVLWLLHRGDYAVAHGEP